jgi:signal transduction histidine kinase/ligand-binding sensor protein
MAIGIEKFKKYFEEVTIDNIFSADLVKQIINGFSHSRQTGIGYIYYGSQGIQQLDDKVESGNDVIHNGVCERIYKQITGGEQKKSCRLCSDQPHFQECIEKNICDLHSFACWLGFKEFAYPLTIAGKIKAMIVSGQVISKTNGIIDSSALDFIRARISENFGNNEDLYNELMDLFEKEINRQKRSELLNEDDIKSKLKALKETLQPIIDRIYEAYKSEGINSLLQESSQYLTLRTPANQIDWWNACLNLFNDFCQITGLKKIMVFSRRGARYRLKTLDKADNGNLPILKSNTILQKTKNNELLMVNRNDKNDQNLAKIIFSCMDENVDNSQPIFLYRYDTGYQQDTYSTVMVLIGAIPNEFLNLITQFCKTVSIHMSISGLIFRMQDSYKAYRENVGLVAHSLRSPLECIALDLQEMEKYAVSVGLLEMIAKIEDSRNRILDTRSDLDFMLESLREVRHEFDIVALLNDIINNLSPIARDRLCEVEWQRKPSGPLIVYANEFAIRIGLECILDNAIKYSYGKGKPAGIVGQKKSYKVYVGVEEDDDLIRIAIKNYGIGMPDEFIKDVLEGKPGTRAGIQDAGMERTGTGWGIPTALRVFQDNGGWFNIVSKPADHDPRKPEEKYHRYVTCAYGNLPKARGISD